MSAATTLSTDGHKRGREIVRIPLREIWADEHFNCRGEIQPQDVAELAIEIKHHGLQNPILVRPLIPSDGVHKYVIISGFRRFAAHLLNRAETIEAEIRYGVDDVQATILNLTENLVRRDLNVMQEARALDRLTGRMSMSQERLAKMLGKSLKWVQVRLWALELEPEIQKDVEKGFLKQEEIMRVRALPKGEARFEAVKKLKKRRLEKVPLRKSDRPIKPNSKRIRDRAETLQMLDHICEALSPNNTFEKLPKPCQYIVRTLSWVAGEATDMEVYTMLKEIAEKRGIAYSPPEEVMEATFPNS
jgi:ParB/RepB/Spo0J family partition protein